MVCIATDAIPTDIALKPSRAEPDPDLPSKVYIHLTGYGGAYNYNTLVVVVVVRLMAFVYRSHRVITPRRP